MSGKVAVVLVSSLAMACSGIRHRPDEPVQEEPGKHGSNDKPPSLLRSFPAKATSGLRGITEVVDFQGALFFGLNPDAGGPSLWRSDGTVAGTVLFKQFPPVSGTRIFGLTVVGNRFFFVADDGEHGAEPWVSDGTPEGTRLLKDITPGAGSSAVEEPVAVGTSLFFVRATPAPDIHEELWKSDGTEAGTVRVKDLGTAPTGGIAIGLSNFGGVLFFSGLDPVHGREPWKSDGTEAGTLMVKDIFPGTASSFPNFPVFVTGGENYFAATTPEHGRELWKSDGTESGTVLVEDIVPGTAGSRPRPFTVYQGRVYFTSSESPDGALRLRKLEPGSPVSEVITDIPNPFGPGAPAPQEPLIINGVEAGGQLFMTVFFPGLTSPTPRDAQLWRTDGTASGTRLLHRPLFISERFRPPNPIPVGDHVFFTGSSAETGDELWKSDGTPEGTRVLQDFLPGPTGSEPLFLRRSGKSLFFVNLGLDRGEQLWALRLPKNK
jgi:ELWxxDGT repeat protein